MAPKSRSCVISTESIAAVRVSTSSSGHWLAQFATNGRLPIPDSAATPPTWVTGSCRAEISRSRQSDFTVFGEPCGISQSLENLFSFQIWIIGQNFFDAAARANLADDHADGYAHTANARLAVPWGPSGRWLHANSRWG